jgi:hypothetical protein
MHIFNNGSVENNAAFYLNRGEIIPAFPYHSDSDKNSRFEHWDSIDKASMSGPNEAACNVLSKIINDGHIRTGWAWRKKIPTIFGPRSANCFTDAPLYQFINDSRNNPHQPYAICLLREEFFDAGGRPAIYGISTPHKELSARSNDAYRVWPRYLNPSCGIAINEQYRYIQISSTEQESSFADRTEWRWADLEDFYSSPGLPIWLKEQNAFSKVLVLVPSTDDIEAVLDQLKELYDAKTHNFGYEYNVNLLSRTYVVAISELEAGLTSEMLATICIEDIPLRFLHAFTAKPASKELIDTVKDALIEAHLVAEVAVKTLERSQGFNGSFCGFSSVTITSAQSDVLSALQEIEAVKVIGGVGYLLNEFGDHGQSLTLSEAGTSAVADFLNDCFPWVYFSTHSTER